MAKYGFPYMGSKADIADELIEILPAGKRFVDLFGGGGAMTHAAVFSQKWNSIYYNEFNPLCVDLMRRAVNGEFNYKTFKPEFISREEFFARKDSDGYVKYIWSFGNRGLSYLFSKNIEEFKRQGHNFIIFGDEQAEEYLQNHFKDSYFWHISGIKNENPLIARKLFVSIILKIEAIRVTKLYSDAVYDKFKNLNFNEFLKLSNKAIVDAINQYIPDIPKKKYKNNRKELSELKQLEQLERLQRLELHQGSYTEYEHQNGDVVYCDPPYEGTAEYSDSFDSQAFYDWVASRDYPVYFSSYEISDTRFHRIWQRRRCAKLSAKTNQTERVEVLYCNTPVANTNKQISIFDYLEVTDERI